MRIYFDTCSLQRPLDDQQQTRIRLEAEAVLGLLTLCEQGRAQLVVSDVIVYESGNNPYPQKRTFVTELLRHAPEYITTTDQVTQRAALFTKNGIKALDALHLALAEIYSIDYFCTCDDRFYRRALRLTDISIKIRMPLELAQELII